MPSRRSKLLLDQIRAIMSERGLTQADFARFKKVSPRSVNKYFTGKRRLVNDTCTDLLDCLQSKMSTTYVFGSTGDGCVTKGMLWEAT